jgi:hypothetical protein
LEVTEPFIRQTGTWEETTIHSFTNGADGSIPQGIILSASGVNNRNEPSGALYGTTQNYEIHDPNPGGNVFQMIPPATSRGNWTFNVLFNFPVVGGENLCPCQPTWPPTMDAHGNLFGSTPGNIYELLPPLAGSTTWTSQNIRKFSDDDLAGYYLTASPVIDSNGVLYATTDYGPTSESQGNCGNFGCGGVFSLTPPKGGNTKWSETVLYDFNKTHGLAGSIAANALTFAGPQANQASKLYGLAAGGGLAGYGTAFELTAP